MDRRKDRRIRAALYCRPAGMEFWPASASRST